MDEKQTASKRAIIARRRKVAAVMRDGVWSVREVARQVGHPRSTVGRDIIAITAAWVEETKTDLAVAKARQLIGIQHRRRVLWQAWERSTQDAEIVTEKTGGERSETVRMRKGQCGDPRYLIEIRALDEREDALLGLSEYKETNGSAVNRLYHMSPEDARAHFRERLATLQPKNQVVED